MNEDSKRINLTVSTELYERIDKYRKENGFSTMASACVQLVTKQLNSAEQGEKIMQLINRLSVEELLKISKEGFEFVKENAQLEEKNKQ